MTKLTRKQREIRDREILIKDTARAMLKKHGFHQLSMDKVAEKVEYSKGTIYQHFNCKEELTCSLCLESMSQLVDMFKKAINFKGNTRERMIAVLYAYVLHSSLNPEAFENLQIVKSEAIQVKLSEEKQQQMLSKEGEVFSVVASVVVDAVNCGDLILANGMTPQEIVFGLWSTAYGGMILDATNINWANMGITDPLAAILKTNQAALDGLNWQPLSNSMDLTPLFERIRTQLFSDEITLHKNTLTKRSIIHG